MRPKAAIVYDALSMGITVQIGNYTLGMSEDGAIGTVLTDGRLLVDKVFTVLQFYSLCEQMTEAEKVQALSSITLRQVNP